MTLIEKLINQIQHAIEVRDAWVGCKWTAMRTCPFTAICSVGMAADDAPLIHGGVAGCIAIAYITQA